MKVFFKGYYGFKNIGDDIFVHTIDWFCKKYNLHYLIHGYELPYGINGKLISNKFKKNFYDLFYAFRANKIIYWGGSTFESISRKTDLKYLLNRLPFLRKKVSLFSISLGPFNNKTEKTKVINFVNKLNYAGVRDEKSLNLSTNTKFTFDLAILTPLIFKANHKNNNPKKIIGLNISDSKNYTEYTKKYINFLIENKKDILEVNVLVFNPNDYDKSAEIANILKQNGIKTHLHKYTRNTEELVNKLSQSDFLMGNRLHSGILAYAYNIPFILNEYHSKCTEFLNTINQEYRYKNLDNNRQNLTDIIEKCKNRKDPSYFLDITLAELENLNNVIKHHD
ncbi:polysaccharide pyruvyl transferase family protein [Staphylococcus borealis]|uniref:polysaccharide pyruvyl transferase family protein n=1 Tax=Staphylococcus borealis TaxID=2742203 RepID=UPI000946FBBB|nr:polysaccharide pyruvyl transferase family protein [Staphylococcus borealis]MDO0993977.1 polysaccharide pyruvyl transferase family protein [Staphylococcus borealis]OLF30449.1 hypothetical protein BSZ10_07425 [Staphylococcus aureus]